MALNRTKQNMFTTHPHRWETNRQSFRSMGVAPAVNEQPGSGAGVPGVVVFRGSGIFTSFTEEEVLQFANELVDALEVARAHVRLTAAA